MLCLCLLHPPAEPLEGPGCPCMQHPDTPRAGLRHDSVLHWDAARHGDSAKPHPGAAATRCHLPATSQSSAIHKRALKHPLRYKNRSMAPTRKKAQPQASTRGANAAIIVMLGRGPQTIPRGTRTGAGKSKPPRPPRGICRSGWRRAATPTRRPSRGRLTLSACWPSACLAPAAVARRPSAPPARSTQTAPERPKADKRGAPAPAALTSCAGSP